MAISGIHKLGLESEQSSGVGSVCDAPHQCGHIWYENPVVLRRDVFLVLLLAHRGPLELLHQLSPLVCALVLLNTFCDKDRPKL